MRIVGPNPASRSSLVAMKYTTLLPSPWPEQREYGNGGRPALQSPRAVQDGILRQAQARRPVALVHGIPTTKQLRSGSGESILRLESLIGSARENWSYSEWLAAETAQLGRRAGGIRYARRQATVTPRAKVCPASGGADPDSRCDLRTPRSRCSAALNWVTLS